MSRPKYEFRTTSKENYLQFCEKHKNVDLTYNQFKKIIYTYNNLLVKYLLETGEAVKMPFGLGTLVINKYKPLMYVKNKEGKEKINLSINWQETKKAGKYVYYLNPHTDGYKYYFMWTYKSSRIKLSHIWKFEMARNNSRLLKDYLKKPNSKYKDIYKQRVRK